jgi:2-methylisocitrate lyase-like PEP mutase family enzyme
LDLRQAFRDLHKTPFIIPNPWDLGSAKILAALGFPALATTSSGFANSLGRPDGRVTRDEAIAHAGAIVRATPLPVSADLENGYGDAPEDAAATLRGALEVGLAGCSIEDFSGSALYDREQAAERIRAAVSVNHASDSPLVLTARAENHIRGNPDLADTIARLQAYQEAGADVLYAPGLTTTDDIKAVTSSVDRPVNVLIMPGGPAVPEIFEAGAIRVSVGSAIAAAAQAAIVTAGRELLEHGTHDFWTRAVGSLGVVMGAMASED